MSIPVVTALFLGGNPGIILIVAKAADIVATAPTKGQHKPLVLMGVFRELVFLEVLVAKEWEFFGGKK